MTVIAVLCSDIHLCHMAPVARSVEPDWYAAMKRSLDQLEEISQEVQAPIICGGDIFDRYNPPPELINFAMQHLPEMYAVPGQHDLPYHNYMDRERSAYFTLVLKGVVGPLDEDHVPWDSNPRFNLFGYPWGREWKPTKRASKPNILVAHRYVWQRGSGYPGAPKELLAGNLPSLEGYDVAVFGDNHQPFFTKHRGCLVVNPGCLIPRKADERSIRPGVYLLRDDLTVARRELDTSEDKWLEPEDAGTAAELDGLQDFIDELRALDADSLDFEAAIRRYCEENKVGDETREMLFDSMGV